VSDIVLTDEQKIKVEQNIGLAMFYYKKYRPPIGMDREDWFQEVMYVLCKAVAIHNQEISSLGCIMRSLLRNKYSDCKWYFSKFNGITSLYSDDDNSESQLVNAIECQSGFTGEQIDARDEVHSIMRRSTERFKKAYSAAISGEGVCEEDQATLTQVRNGFGNSGRVNCCDYCCSIFIGCSNGQSRFCSKCKVIKKRIDDRISSSRQREKKRELVK
jgi:hypothetical protein